ncbi:spore coat protein U domain-containing protein [Sphingomonas parapaucimobilis]|uniref:spore coat protein U domain-containing protein n=1 Tax=Sphingomonas parapaucimobilis TaxID=28213 RepID=UPI0039E756F9
MARMIRAVAGTIPLLGLTMLGTSPAHAGSVARAFQVQAYYGVTCEASFAGSLNFGLINSQLNTSQSTFQTVGSMIVNCSSATPFGIWSALSANANGPQRRMFNAAQNAYLSYDLLYPSGPNSNQPVPTTQNTTGYTSLAGGQTYVSGIMARLSPGQSFQSGHYQDDIVITVSY